MKRKLTLISAAFLLSAAFTLMSCGNDDENNNTTFITPDGKVDVTRAVEFKVNFGDYNSEEEMPGTRAAKTEGSDTLSRQYVELGNGLLAEVTVQKDTAKTQTSGQRPVTRALTDDTYTMLAYKDGVFQGSVTGTVSSGVFRANPDESEGIALVSGRTYDFVLFNSRVSRSGNNLTVNLSDVETAFIGRAQYEVTTDRNQQVTFTMKHAGSRLRIKLTGYVGITAGTAATLSSVDATSVPNTAVYDASTDTWSNGAGAATSGSLTFPASTEEAYNHTTYTSQSNEYLYFLPSTNPSRLKLKFTGGSIYNQDMTNAGMTLSVPTVPSMKANASYVINVKLMYSVIYLMSDGTTGSFKATTYGGGTKTPIGVVLSKSKRLAMALKETNNGAERRYSDGTALYRWYKEDGRQVKHNYRYYNVDIRSGTGNGIDYWRNVIWKEMDGYKYTWESNGPDGSSDIKAEKLTSGVPDYPAFYYAGHYGDELAASGITVSGGMTGKKWHLPSAGEWNLVFTALGFGDGATQEFNYSPWYGKLVEVAFTQVEGRPPFGRPGESEYWTSTEVTDYDNMSVRAYPDAYSMDYLWVPKSYAYFVRAFIYY